jgi:dihydrodipicolinate synthase/N-acetylneuraminate lyase
MGEAIHLSHAERVTLILTARETLDRAGLTHMPLIAGTGAGSTRETIELCEEAANAGADYAIVIASGYFAGALLENKKALKAFWSDVAENSPIPVMIYNCRLSDFFFLRLGSVMLFLKIRERAPVSTWTLILSLTLRPTAQISAG